jgi:uncharacterized protein YndB with AHSA1/START domain
MTHAWCAMFGSLPGILGSAPTVARNEVTIDVPPEAVWAVLEDPYAYPKWVVGTDRTLEADPGFPAPGTKFKVHIALGLKDHTKVVEVDPGRKIVLDAAASFFGPVRVAIELEPRGSGTHVTLIENPHGKMLPWRFFPPAHLGIKVRNVESLRRFERLVKARAVPA